MPSPEPSRSRALIASLASLLAAVVLAACGPDDRPTGEDVPPPSLTTPTTTTARADKGAGGKADRGNKADKGDDDGGDDDGGGGGGRGGGGGGRSSGGSDDGGGGGGAPGAGTERPSVPDTRTTLRVSAAPDGRLEFVPTTLRARPGHITIIMRNPSSVRHGIGVAGDDIDRNSGEEGVGRGQEARVTVALPAGEYEFYCPVGDHRINLENGGPMSGFLTVG